MVRYQAVVKLEGGEERTGITRKSKADAIQDLVELKKDYDVIVKSWIEEWTF